jgi:hypothetical protein
MTNLLSVSHRSLSAVAGNVSIIIGGVAENQRASIRCSHSTDQ